MAMVDKATGQESKSQADKFKEAARELGCDDDEALFQKHVVKIASPLKRSIGKDEEDKEFRKLQSKKP